jgi:hypothetical protein
MARSKRIIEVPHPAPGSFNPDRPLRLNTLLLNQVKHFQEIERSRMTEGQASEYIQRMTALLHAKTEAAGGKPIQ